MTVFPANGNPVMSTVFFEFFLPPNTVLANCHGEGGKVVGKNTLALIHCLKVFSRLDNHFLLADDLLPARPTKMTRANSSASVRYSLSKMMICDGRMAIVVCTGV